MATGNYTHGAAATMADHEHTTAQENSSLSTRAEALRRWVARYALVVVAGWQVSEQRG